MLPLPKKIYFEVLKIFEKNLRVHLYNICAFAKYREKLIVLWSM
jgi:hypothetical protein